MDLLGEALAVYIVVLIFSFLIGLWIQYLVTRAAVRDGVTRAIEEHKNLPRALDYWAAKVAEEADREREAQVAKANEAAVDAALSPQPDQLGVPRAAQGIPPRQPGQWTPAGQPQPWGTQPGGPRAPQYPAGPGQQQPPVTQQFPRPQGPYPPQGPGQPRQY